MVATVNGLVPSEAKAGVLERVLMVGDLSKLTPEDRISYYRGVCDSLGLNPFTRPFDYLSLNNRLVLYAKREAAEQLRKLHGVSIEKIEKEIVNGVYVVTAHAKDKDGRQDIGTGAVALCQLQGDALANAIMKAETKAKRRVTLSICGLGFLDESEIETVPDAQPANVDHETGEIIETPEPQQSTQPCPVCNGSMWDNRAENESRERRGEKRRPDFKCRDKNCNGVIWDARPTCTESQLEMLNTAMSEYGQALADKRSCDIRDGHGLALKKITDKIKGKYKYLQIGAEMNPTEIFSQLKQADADHVVNWISQVLATVKVEVSPEEVPTGDLNHIPF